MKKIVLMLILLVTLFACSSGSSGFISGDEAKKLIADGAILVDVRTVEEFNESHIEGAINVPLADIQAKDFSMISDVDATYVIYCRSGSRATTAIQVLEENNYSNLNNLGGMSNYDK